MRLNAIAIIIISLLINMLPSFVYAEIVYTIDKQEKYNDKSKNYLAVVSKKEIVDSPSFRVDVDEPPLGVKQAIENAKTYILSKIPDFTNPEVLDVFMFPFRHDNDIKDKWYYTINFANKMQLPNKIEPFGFDGNMECLRITVLMNSKVVELQTVDKNKRMGNSGR